MPHLLDAQGEYVVFANSERPSQFFGVLLGRVKGFKEVCKIALEIAPLPRGTVVRYLAIVPARSRAALPVALVID